MKLKVKMLQHAWKKIDKGLYQCQNCGTSIQGAGLPPIDLSVKDLDMSDCLVDSYIDFGPGEGYWPEYSPPLDKDERLYAGDLTIKLIIKNPELNTAWIGRAYDKRPAWIMECVSIHYKLCNEAKSILKSLSPDMVKSLVTMLPEDQKEHLAKSGLLTDQKPEKYSCAKHELMYDTIIRTLNLKISAGVDPNIILAAISSCGVTQ